MQALISSKSAGVTGGRGTAGAGPGRDLLYQSCLRHHNSVLVEEVLTIFIPLVPVNDTGFETSAEDLENLFIL